MGIALERARERARVSDIAALFECPIEIRTVRANGRDFEVLVAGTGDRLALLLHGFPEHAISWRYQIPLLVRLGYLVWAPNQRGYGNSSRPKAIREYRMRELVADVAGLIDASGATSVTLVGHDWGAAVAWVFATLRPRPIERLAIVNVPHPAVFARVLRTSWRQRLRSWYMLYFQIPWLPERTLGADRAAAIGAIFRKTAANPERFSREAIDVYRDAAARPGALAAMLAWYRAAARFGLDVPRGGFAKIDVPTLVVWGEEDTALGKETTYGTERYVADLRVAYLPGVSHWAQQDAPERVNALLERFLADDVHAAE